MAGIPSQINIHRQPTVCIRYPDMMDIHNIHDGFPNINKVFALDLSFLVNHLLNNRSKEGNKALSATPTMKRTTSKIFILFIKPVAAANRPQRISDQKINFLALFFAAYNVPGIWKKKYPRKNM